MRACADGEVVKAQARPSRMQKGVNLTKLQRMILWCCPWNKWIRSIKNPGTTQRTAAAVAQPRRRKLANALAKHRAVKHANKDPRRCWSNTDFLVILCALKIATSDNLLCLGGCKSSSKLWSVGRGGVGVSVHQVNQTEEVN